MAESKAPEMRLEYRGFTPRNYGVALSHRDSFTLIDPLSFFMGRWRVSRPSMRRKYLEEYLTFERRERAFTPIFDSSKVRSLDVLADDEFVRRRKSFAGLSIDEAWRNFEEWVFDRYANTNLLREGGEKVFRELSLESPYEGEINLHGEVRKKGIARGTSRFHHVHIRGPFTDSAVRLHSIYCDDRESLEMMKRGGYRVEGWLCPEAAALLFFSRYNPTFVENLEQVIGRRNNHIWLPFHPYEIQTPVEELETIATGKQPRLSNVMVAALIEYFSRGMNKAEINNRLMKLNVIWDPDMRRYVDRGDARLVVVPNKWIFDRSDVIPGHIRAMYDAAHNRLTTEERYRFVGFTFEKKDTPYQMVAMEYQRGDRFVRLLFFDNLPPLEQENVVVRANGVDIFNREKKGAVHVEKQHPYADVYQPKIRFDDSRRRYVASETRFLSSWVPEDVVPDLHDAVEFYVRNGNNELRRRLGGSSRRSMIERAGWDLPIEIDKRFAYHVTKYTAATTK